MPITAEGVYGSLATNSIKVREINATSKVSIGAFEAGETMTVKILKLYYNFLGSSEFTFTITT